MVKQAAAGSPAASGPDAARGGPFSAHRLAREVLVYGLGTAAGHLASIIMLPVYTRLLTPSDYGLLQMLDMLLEVAAIMMSAGVTTGVMRFYFKAGTARARQEVLGSAFVLQCGLNMAGTVLLVLCAGPIWRLGLRGAGTVTLVYIAAINFTLAVLGEVPMLKMQMERRAVLYSIATVIRVIVQLSLNIVFLVVLRWGVRGILLSTLVTHLVVGGSTFVWMVTRTPLRISRAAVYDLRRFGVPYQITTAATFILTFGDRYFLEAFQGLSAVGIYSLAYQFGFLMTKSAFMPFVRAWLPRRHQLAFEPRAFRDAKYNEGFHFLNLLLLTTAAAIAVFIRPALQIMSDPPFWPAATIVPVVLAAYILQCWTVVVSFGIDVSEKTKYATYANWIAVVVVVAFYALLIPRFGAMGAAVATLIAFAVRFAVGYYFSYRLWPVSYHWGRALRLLTIVAVVTLVAFAVDPSAVGGKVLLGIGLMGAYLGAAWFAALDRGERRRLRQALASPGSALATFARS